MEKQWYVYRAHQTNIHKVKTILVSEGIEHFISFIKDGKCSVSGVSRTVPLVLNYVFIRTFPGEFDNRTFPVPLYKCYDRQTNAPMTVPDRQMESFMFIHDFSEKAMLLSNDNLHRGDRVRVLKGDFAGIEGELIRIRGHKRVVVRLEGLMSLAVDTYIPKSFLEIIKKVNE